MSPAVIALLATPAVELNVTLPEGHDPVAAVLDDGFKKPLSPTRILLVNIYRAANLSLVGLACHGDCRGRYRDHKDCENELC